MRRFIHTHQNWLLPFFTMVLLLVSLFSAMLFTVAVAAVTPISQNNQVLFICSTVLVSALAVCLVWLCNGKNLAASGLIFNRRTIPMFVLGILACGIPMFVAALLGNFLWPATTAMPAGTAHPGLVAIITTICSAVLVQGFPEELLFRGFLLTKLQMSKAGAVAVSVGVFTVLHLISNGGQQNLFERFAYLALPGGFSLLAAILAVKFSSLWCAVGVHAGFHFTAKFLINPLALAFGWQAWLLVGLFLAVPACILATTVSWREPLEYR